MSSTYNMSADQGATFTFSGAWTDSLGAKVNLTGYTARMVISTVTENVLILTLTESTGITLGGTNGTIAITITATQTAAIEEGRYVYNLTLTAGPGGTVTRLLEGEFTVTEDTSIPE